MFIEDLYIILDIDGVLCDFVSGFEKQYKCKIEDINPRLITKRVNCKLIKDTKFWINLPALSNIDFIPYAYCTARVNSKYSTKKWLQKNGYNNSPIYQCNGFSCSKIPQLKRIISHIQGCYYVLIDDNWNNVQEAVNNGIPALLKDTPFNRHIDTNLRITELNKQTIYNAYKRLYF